MGGVKKISAALRPLQLETMGDPDPHRPTPRLLKDSALFFQSIAFGWQSAVITANAGTEGFRPPSVAPRGGRIIDIVCQHCCGLDVHKKSVVACVITPEGQQSRTFRTLTADLLSLADWLRELQVSHAAMESTGVYWKPVYNLLEDEFTVIVVNAAHIKRVPGRKTDVTDARWIAQLLQHGLLRPSFIPDRLQRELRELNRYRRSLIEERSREANRIQKLLEGANIKLSSVATDVLGASGRAMLAAMAAGEEDPERLAELAKGRLREKRADLEQALRGLMGHHQRYLLTRQLSHLEFLSREIDELDREVAQRVDPFEETVRAVDTIPGIGQA